MLDNRTPLIAFSNYSSNLVPIEMPSNSGRQAALTGPDIRRKNHQFTPPEPNGPGSLRNVSPVRPELQECIQVVREVIG